MPFTLAKILAHLVQPTSLAVIALTIGLVLMQRGRRVRLGGGLAWGGLIYLWIAGLSPLGNALILPLEERFPPLTREEEGRVDGIIMLGGFEDGWVSNGRGGFATNEAGERVMEGMRLALRHPEARVVFTGGVGQVWARGLEATGPVAQFLVDGGVARERLVLEGRSRNTYENAVFTRELVGVKPGERWLLVTSAYHMPRSMGIFRQVGFPVVAYPVDYRTHGASDLTNFFERFIFGFARVDTAVNEWIGLVAYWVMGRTDALFPGP